MPLMKLIVVTVVLVLIIGGTLQYMGYIKLGNDGPRLTAGSLENNLDDYETADAAYIANKYDEALAGYKKALEKSPDSDKAPSAMYRIGQCFEALNKSDDAIAAYKAFVDKYPNDPNARRASERIEYLKDASNK